MNLIDNYFPLYLIRPWLFYRALLFGQLCFTLTCHVSIKDKNKINYFLLTYKDTYLC
jgi:hypothetical protein